MTPSPFDAVRLSRHPPSIDPTRLSRRPTTAFSNVSQRIQEVVLSVFKQHSLTSVDLEALIYLCLQSFDVGPDTYEQMYKTVKSHILKNFAIHQGDYIRLHEHTMRRIVVVWTDDGS